MKYLKKKERFMRNLISSMSLVHKQGNEKIVSSVCQLSKGDIEKDSADFPKEARFASHGR